MTPAVKLFYLCKIKGIEIIIHNDNKISITDPQFEEYMSPITVNVEDVRFIAKYWRCHE